LKSKEIWPEDNVTGPKEKGTWDSRIVSQNEMVLSGANCDPYTRVSAVCTPSLSEVKVIDPSDVRERLIPQTLGVLTSKSCPHRFSSDAPSLVKGRHTESKSMPPQIQIPIAPVEASTQRDSLCFVVEDAPEDYRRRTSSNARNLRVESVSIKEATAKATEEKDTAETLGVEVMDGDVQSNDLYENWATTSDTSGSCHTIVENRFDLEKQQEPAVQTMEDAPLAIHNRKRRSRRGRRDIFLSSWGLRYTAEDSESEDDEEEDTLEWTAQTMGNAEETNEMSVHAKNRLDKKPTFIDIAMATSLEFDPELDEERSQNGSEYASEQYSVYSCPFALIEEQQAKSRHVRSTNAFSPEALIRAVEDMSFSDEFSATETISRRRGTKLEENEKVALTVGLDETLEMNIIEASCKEGPQLPEPENQKTMLSVEDEAGPSLSLADIHIIDASKIFTENKQEMDLIERQVLVKSFTDGWESKDFETSTKLGAYKRVRRPRTVHTLPFKLQLQKERNDKSKQPQYNTLEFPIKVLRLVSTEEQQSSSEYMSDEEKQLQPPRQSLLTTVGVKGSFELPVGLPELKEDEVAEEDGNEEAEGETVVKTENLKEPAPLHGELLTPCQGISLDELILDEEDAHSSGPSKSANNDFKPSEVFREDVLRIQEDEEKSRLIEREQPTFALQSMTPQVTRLQGKHQYTRPIPKGALVSMPDAQLSIDPVLFDWGKQSLAWENPTTFQNPRVHAAFMQRIHKKKKPISSSHRQRAISQPTTPTKKTLAFDPELTTLNEGVRSPVESMPRLLSTSVKSCPDSPPRDRASSVPSPELSAQLVSLLRINSIRNLRVMLASPRETSPVKEQVSSSSSDSSYRSESPYLQERQQDCWTKRIESTV